MKATAIHKRWRATWSRPRLEYIAQPRPGPQGLDADLDAGRQPRKGASRQNSGSFRMRSIWANCSPKLGIGAFAVTARHDGENHAGNGEDKASENEEGIAPAELAHQIFGGFRRHDDAERAHRHDAGIGERAALRRNPERGRLEARHEAAGKTQADNGPGEKQCDEAGREGEERAARRAASASKADLDAAWTIAVEQDTERQLEQGESQQIGRGQKPKLGRGQLKIRSRDRAPPPHSRRAADRTGDSPKRRGQARSAMMRREMPGAMS